MGRYVDEVELYLEWSRLVAIDFLNLHQDLAKDGHPLSGSQETRVLAFALRAFHENWDAVQHRASWREIPDVRVDASAALRQQVFERDEFTCLKCGVTDEPLHADHVLPVFHGGETVLGNLQTLCAACNMSKGVDAVRYVSG